MVVGPCAGGELPAAGQLRPSIIIVQAIQTIFYHSSIAVSPSHTLPTTTSIQLHDSHTHEHSHHGESQTQRRLIHQTGTRLTHDLSLPQSLRIVPHAGHAQQTALAPSAPSAPGVHDTLRSNQSLNTPHNASPAFSAVASSHPLEARLSNWRSTQDALKMSMLRREFGIAEPIRRAMEVKICQEGEWRPAVLGYKGEGLHEQILSGRDASVDWEDVFNGEFCVDGEEE
jgi:proteasome maturation protein